VVHEQDRGLVLFVGIVHAMVHTYELAIPLLMTAWLLEFQTTPAVLGIVVTAGYALWGLGAIPGGLLADRYGSRRLVLFSLTGMGLAFGLLGAAPSLPVLAFALILWGTAASVYHPAGLALISRQAVQPGRSFAYHGITGNIGTGIGPLITALLLAFVDWRLVAGLLALPSIVGLLITYPIDVVEDEVDAGATNTREMFTDAVSDSRLLFASPFLIVFPVIILYGLYLRGSLTFLPTVLIDLSNLQPVSVSGREFEPGNYLYAGMLLIGTFGQYAAGRAADHFEDRPEIGLITTLGLLVVLSIVFIPIAGIGFAPFVVVTAVLGIVLFAVQPFEHAAISAYTSPETRGLSFGFMSLGVFGVGAIGASITGVILSYGSLPILFMMLAGIALGGALIAFRLRRHRPQTAAATNRQ